MRKPSTCKPCSRKTELVAHGALHFSYEENRQVDSIYLEAWQDWDGVTGNSAYLQGIEPSTGKTKFV